MKKFEITKEQILELYNSSGQTNDQRYKQWFPEAFESELEVGKWYKGNKCLFFITDFKLRNQAFGFNIYKEWVNKSDGWCFKNIELATSQEVETALKNEAKKRGFKGGVTFKSVEPNVSGKRIFTMNNSIYYSQSGDYIYSSSGYIFKDGKWATIIPQPLTLEERVAKLEKQLSCNQE